MNMELCLSLFENKSELNLMFSLTNGSGFGITKDSRDVGAAAVALTYLTGEVAEMMFNAIGVRHIKVY